MIILNENKIFENREQAAQELAERLSDLKEQNPLVLAVPRGAVNMAKIIAMEIGGEMDVVLVKKICHPLHEDYAIGSVTEEGNIILGAAAFHYGLTRGDIEDQASKAAAQLKERRGRYSSHTAINPVNRTVVIVDDGIATGSTMSAAVKCLKDKGARRIVVATPVASRESIEFLTSEGIEIRVIKIPENFETVSLHYNDFTEVQ